MLPGVGTMQLVKGGNGDVPGYYLSQVPGYALSRTVVPVCFGAQRQIDYADLSYWWFVRCSFKAVPGRQCSAISRAVSRSDWWSRRQESGGGLFRRICELFSVIWINSVAMTAFSHTRSRSNSVTSFSFDCSFGMLRGLSREADEYTRFFWENPYGIARED